MTFRRLALSSAVASVGCVAVAAAQTTTSGYNLAVRSSGTRSQTAGTATLTQNGYVGTYITLASPGTVTLAVDASGQAGGGADPRMNLVVDDSTVGWSVGSTANTYSTTLSLPAGTHFVRAEFANDVATADRRLTVRNLQVTGASVANAGTSANALAAADTYVANYRKGDATLTLAGAAPGASVDVRLTNHAFRFGTKVNGSTTSGSVNTYLNNPQFAQNLLANFNSVTPENAGKWANNEGTRDRLTMSGVDRILDFAEQNGLRARMHNLIWGEQQPAYINALVTSAAAGDAAARATLDAEVAQRIAYLVGGARGAKADQIDVFNESVHTGVDRTTPNFWNVLGAAGVAKVYNDVAAAGGKTFVNEYNVLADGVDAYANWYRSHVETIRAAGGRVDGVGIQYYAHNDLGTSNAQHDPARIFNALQNLSIGGQALELTEFGIKSDGAGTAAEKDVRAAQVLTETMRLVFGNAASSGFTVWGFWEGDMWEQAPAGALYNADWTLTPAGEAYRDLMTLDADADAADDWTTQLAATVRPDGTIAFNGFYGDYDLTIGGKTYAFTLEKGITSYALQVPEPAMLAAVGTALTLALRSRSYRAHVRFSKTIAVAF